ncbi:MAG: M12 family metallo-peptidase [Phycisphaerales bacterium]
MHQASVLCGIASLSLGLLSTSAMAQFQHHQLEGTQVQLESLSNIQVGDHVRIEDFQAVGTQYDLELDRIEVLTDDAQLVVGTKDGMIDLPRPEVILLSGIVAGDANSRAFISLSPYGTNGYIEQHGEMVSISTGPYELEKNLEQAIRTAHMADMINPNAVTHGCGYTNGDAAFEPMGLPDQSASAASPRGGTTCRIAGIAVETDYEFTDRLFNGNTNAAAAYLVSLVAAISEIYERDVDARLAIPYLRVWADNSDPYEATTGDPLDQVRNHWNASMGHVERTVTHMFTGRENTSYGGVAYVGVLCNESYGYGVSAHLDGSFPYPLVDHNYGNWDVIVAAHELGHNFGTGHTHSYSPPIDGCGSGDCSDPYGGTIMSYCHGCSGGLSNIVLEFHPRVKNTIINFMNNANCDLISEGVTAAEDFAETLEGTAVEIDALSNDLIQSCDPFVLESFDSTTFGGGTVELLAGAGPDGRDIFRYTPAAGYSGNDLFSYTIAGDAGNQSTVVNLSVRELRPADARLSPIPGLSVSYYQLNNPSVLPDFDAMTPIATDVSMNVDYPSTGGEFMNSGLADEVGAVFEGYVWALFDGIYTFSTNSDDGSALYIGDEQVVNNDGLHGMVSRSGTIPLAAGWHKIRVEFFENGGGAGLITTMTGPGIPETTLNGLYITHESATACSAADFNADGELNFFDVTQFIDAFNSQDAAADMNSDGLFNFFDVSEFLVAYGEGCP